MMPVLFIAHGAPILLDSKSWVSELAAWSTRIAKPRAIVVLSAHWERAPLAIGTTRTLPLIYDFSGFPERFYRLQYSAPGAPEVAARIRDLASAAGIAIVDDGDRGWDHGVYVPLLCMYPAADIPLLQLSLPSFAARPLWELGQALAPLRDEGVLIVGSGYITHNLATMRSAATPPWAAAFDSWTADVLVRHDHEALLDYVARAPGVAESLPTHEHFAPLITAVGAAPGAAVSFPITGWGLAGFGGSLTRRSVQLG